MFQKNKKKRNNNMTNIIGPIDQNTWTTMRDLREDISFMGSRNQDGKFDAAILREKNLLGEYFGLIRGRAA